MMNDSPQLSAGTLASHPPTIWPLCGAEWGELTVERACRPLRLFRGGAAIEAQGCRGSQSEPKRRSLPFCCLCATLKLLQRLADNSLAQRSTILAAQACHSPPLRLPASVSGLQEDSILPVVTATVPNLATADYAGGRVGGVPPNAPAKQPRVTDAAEYTIRHNVNEVRLQFTVAYEPGSLPADNLARRHSRAGRPKSQVELRAPQRFQVHARQGYFAAEN